MKLKVGYCYNLAENFQKQNNDPKDIGIEWSSRDYIMTVKEGIKNSGFEVFDIGDPVNLLREEIRTKIDIVFSIAEMMGYRYREILVPTICEMYDIPYLFARPDSMLITADKHLSNLVVERLGYKVPTWILFDNNSRKKSNFNSFPCIVKPNAEGSSMGITINSIFETTDGLWDYAKQKVKNYSQPAMIQEFIQGQEITIGVIQEKGTTLALIPLETFSPIEGMTTIFDQETKYKYKDQKLFQPLKEPTLISKVKKAAVDIFDEIGCRDAARIDFRVKNKELYFIEVNGLTDFHPEGAFCISAKLAGFDYFAVLKTIIMNSWMIK